MSKNLPQFVQNSSLTTGNTPSFMQNSSLLSAMNAPTPPIQFTDVTTLGPSTLTNEQDALKSQILGEIVPEYK